MKDACYTSGTASMRHCADARKLHARMGVHSPSTTYQELCTDACTPGPSVMLALNLLEYNLALQNNNNVQCANPALHLPPTLAYCFMAPCQHSHNSESRTSRRQTSQRASCAAARVLAPQASADKPAESRAQPPAHAGWLLAQQRSGHADPLPRRLLQSAPLQTARLASGEPPPQLQVRLLFMDALLAHAARNGVLRHRQAGRHSRDLWHTRPVQAQPERERMAEQSVCRQRVCCQPARRGHTSVREVSRNAFTAAATSESLQERGQQGARRVRLRVHCSSKLGVAARAGAAGARRAHQVLLLLFKK